VFAENNGRRDTVSAWMMMKRGCRVMAHGENDIELLRRYDPALRVLTDAEIENGSVKEILGMVLGTSLEELDSVDVSKYDVPVYFPTIGMTDADVDSLYDAMVRSEF